MDDTTSRRGPRNTIGLIAGALFIIGPALAGLRMVPGLVGFGLFALGGLVALVVGLVSVVQAVRGRGLGRGGAFALGVGVVFFALASRGFGLPRINDFTTDPNDPPAFTHVATMSPNAGRNMGYPSGFAEIQRACCADLRPLRLGVGAPEAFTRAERVARGMPSWEVVWTDPASGMIEAVATSRLFGFHDDIVIRVRPEADGASRIDMRSKSRDGQGDFGVNAARIRAYVATVEAGK
jgi:uncharacterized protein (DUF1499 family)